MQNSQQNLPVYFVPPQSPPGSVPSYADSTVPHFWTNPGANQTSEMLQHSNIQLPHQYHNKPYMSTRYVPLEIKQNTLTHKELQSLFCNLCLNPMELCARLEPCYHLICFDCISRVEKELKLKCPNCSEKINVIIAVHPEDQLAVCSGNCDSLNNASQQNSLGLTLGRAFLNKKSLICHETFFHNSVSEENVENKVFDSLQNTIPTEKSEAYYNSQNQIDDLPPQDRWAGNYNGSTGNVYASEPPYNNAPDRAQFANQFSQTDINFDKSNHHIPKKDTLQNNFNNPQRTGSLAAVFRQTQDDDLNHLL